MKYFRNSNAEDINAFIVYARPDPVTNEATSTMLNGKWFIQQVGAPAEKVSIELVCGWDVVQEIQGYAKTKEHLTIRFLDFEKTGFIVGIPAYDIQAKKKDSPIYSVNIELAVIPNV